jgi:Tfp pilus assembly protein PilF
VERIEKILTLLKDNPTDNFLQHALALEYIKAGEDAKAKQIFLDLLQHDPSYIGSYYHLAKLLERTGEQAAAIKWYKQGMAEAGKQNDTKTYNELEAACEDLADS